MDLALRLLDLLLDRMDLASKVRVRLDRPLAQFVELPGEFAEGFFRTPARRSGFSLRLEGNRGRAGGRGAGTGRPAAGGAGGAASSANARWAQGPLGSICMICAASFCTSAVRPAAAAMLAR